MQLEDGRGIENHTITTFHTSCSGVPSYVTTTVNSVMSQMAMMTLSHVAPRHKDILLLLPHFLIKPHQRSLRFSTSVIFKF
jgi:hypothetical protein